MVAFAPSLRASVMDDRIPITSPVEQTSSRAMPGIGDGFAHWRALRDKLRELVTSERPDAEADFRAAYDELNAVPVERTCAAIVESYFALSEYYYYEAQQELLDVTAKVAVAHARALGDRGLLRRALTIFCSCVVDFSEAVEALREALTIARELGDPIGEVSACNNLGNMLITAGLHREAMPWLQRAAKLARDSDNRQGELLACANIANAAHNLGDLSTGVAAATRAIALLGTNEFPHSWQYVLAHVNLVLLLTSAGDILAAEKAAEEGRRVATISARSQLVWLVATGWLDVHADRAESGLRKLRQSVTDARTSVRQEYREALSRCITAHEIVGQDDVALFYTHELLAFNRESKAANLLTSFNALTSALGAAVTPCGQVDHYATTKALDLQHAVDKRIAEITNATITGLEVAGYDRVRVFRVARLAELFAVSEGWDEGQARALGFACRFADVGTMVIPDKLLQKPRALSVAERKIVCEHIQFGADLLTRARLAVLQPAVPLAKFHHEKYDGTGPWGLSGEAIPIEAQLYSLCDVFDALTHERPWRSAYSLPTALRTMAAEAGTRFDPGRVERFIAFLQREYWRHDNLDRFLAEAAQENAYVRAREQIDRLITSGA